MKKGAIQLYRSTGTMLIVSVLLGLITLGMTSERIFITSFENVFAQQNMTNMTSPTQLMTGGGGMQQGGGQGMSGMGGMGDNTGNTPGMIKEMCHMGEDMPPHYCEPAYHVMSSVKGIRINDVSPVNDKELELEIQNMNRDANVTNLDIVIVGGGGGSLAGASVIQGGWNNSTQGYLKLDGSGSIYDLNSVHIHLFPLTE
jgi:hypothetical protein